MVSETAVVTLTTTFIVAFFTALPPTFVAYIGWRQNKKIIRKTDEIGESTNGNMQALRQELRFANEKILRLELLLRKHYKEGEED